MFKHKKLMGILLGCAVALTSALPASAANFSDINQVPWAGAATYINQVADANLMVGDTDLNGNRTFRPKDNVTYCETAQLVYTLLSSYYGSSVTADIQSKYAATLANFVLPEWAKPALAYCMDKGAITTADLAKFSANTAAPREDVALYFGRGLATLLSVNSSATLSFNDAATISASTVPYLDILVRANIISGDNNGNFNPKNNINRSEMAVIVAKTNDYLKTQSGSSAASGTVTGNILSLNISGSAVTLTVQDSATSSVKMLTGTTSTPCKSGTATVSITSLATGDMVTASYTGTTLTSVIASSKSGGTTASSTQSGTYVGLAAGKINVRIDGRETTYTLASGCTYFLGGAESTQAQVVASTQDGDKVTLGINNAGQVIKVAVTYASTSDYDVKGYFSSISSNYVTLKKSTTSSSTTKYYYLDNNSDNVSFFLNGVSSTYAKVKDAASENDEVTLWYDTTADKDHVVTLRLKTTSDDYDETGYFYSIGDKYIAITSKQNSTSSTKYYFVDDDSSNTDFYIKGSSKTYSNFKNNVSTGDKIGLKFNSDEEVTDVYLVSSSDSADESGYFYSISTKSIKITSSKSSSSTKTYDFEDEDEGNVTFYVGSSKKTYSTFKSTVEKGDKIELTLNDDDEVTEVKLKTGSSTDLDDCDVTGYIDTVSTTGIKIKKSKTSSSSTNYYYEDKDSSNVEFYIDGDSVTYSKFKNNADEDTKIGVNLDDDDRIVEAYIGESSSDSEEIDGYFYSVDESEIKIKSSKTGSSKTYAFDDDDYTNVTFYIDGSKTSYSKFENTVQTNDEITLELEDDVVTEVYAVLIDDEDVSGTVEKIYDDEIKVDGDTYDVDSGDVTVKVTDGSTTITDYDDLQAAFNDDGKSLEVTLVTSDGEATKITGYVSKATGEINTISSTKVKLEFDTTSETYTFASSVDSDDIDDAMDEYDDGDIDEMTVKLNSSGKVTSFTTR